MKLIIRLGIFTLLAAFFAAPPPNFAASPICNTSNPPGSLYTVELCIDAPEDKAVVSGFVAVQISVNVIGNGPTTAEIVTDLNGSYLLTDYAAPFSFELPTEYFVDGTYTLAAQAVMHDSYTTDATFITLTFNNGFVDPPVNPNTFTPYLGSPKPGQPFIVAAVGDGANGEWPETPNLITSWNPDMFLYLGDVYDKGTYAEFYNWYGPDTRDYGLLRSITNPTIGNHEYTGGLAPGYLFYWDNAPLYYSYDVAGWHFISINSNGRSTLQGPGDPQYDWLVQDLTDNTSDCTIAYYHHPRYSIGNHGSDTSLAALWSLLATYGVDVVLNGHEHNYQRWFPLDADGNIDPTGMTEFVVGSGGRGTTGFISTDNRFIIGYDTRPDAIGALRMELNPGGMSYTYVNMNGVTLDSGSVACTNSGDVQAPSAPTNLVATDIQGNHLDLGWDAATDDVGVVAYNIYRDGGLLGGSLMTTYQDQTVLPETNYQYTVRALDAGGNESDPSNPLNVTTPAQAPELHFTPTDDATIRESSPTSNYGANTTLEVDASSVKDILLRFDVSGIGTNAITSATLRLYNVDSSSYGGDFYRVTYSVWDESTVTWENAPAADGGLIASLGPVAAGNWYELDVTSLVTGDGVVSLRISSPNDNGADYSSKEDVSGLVPELVVVLDQFEG